MTILRHPPIHQGQQGIWFFKIFRRQKGIENRAIGLELVIVLFFQLLIGYFGKPSSIKVVMIVLVRLALVLHHLTTTMMKWLRLWKSYVSKNQISVVKI